MPEQATTELADMVDDYRQQAHRWETHPLPAPCPPEDADRHAADWYALADLVEAACGAVESMPRRTAGQQIAAKVTHQDLVDAARRLAAHLR